MTLAQYAAEFWQSVLTRLVTVHRIERSRAQRSVRKYKKLVGVVALNSSDKETARDIAHAIRQEAVQSSQRETGKKRRASLTQ